MLKRTKDPRIKGGITMANRLDKIALTNRIVRRSDPKTIRINRYDHYYAFTDPGLEGGRSLGTKEVHRVWRPLCKVGKSFQARLWLFEREKDPEFLMRVFDNYTHFYQSDLSNGYVSVCWICNPAFRRVFGIQPIATPELNEYVPVAIDIELL